MRPDCVHLYVVGDCVHVVCGGVVVLMVLLCLRFTSSIMIVLLTLFHLRVHIYVVGDCVCCVCFVVVAVLFLMYVGWFVFCVL